MATKMATGEHRELTLETTSDEDTATGANRRLHERVTVDLEVDYKADDTFLFAYITDISAMGIFVRTNSPETPGTRLNLRFTPPGDERNIEFEGEVIWINPYRPNTEGHPGMGIQFINLTPSQRDQLLELVRTFAYLNDPSDDADEKQ